MKLIKKFTAVLALVSIIAMPGSALAVSPGQLAGGPNYQVKNLTQSGSYGSAVTAACNDELEYSMQLSNGDYGALSNVMLTATLPAAGGVSTATATTNLGGTSGTSDSVTANLSSTQTQTLENGTTVLYNSTGNAIETLPDTITTTGVNIGTLDGSTTEYVNFKAKVNCPTPIPTYACNLLTLTQSGNTVTASVTTTATNGATLTNVSYNFGNGTTPIVSSNANVSYTYPAATTNTSYTVTAIPTFSVNGSSQTAGSASCVKTVSIVAPTTPVTPVTPTTTPTALVNTGPGNVIGIFAATSIVAAVAHRLFKNRQIVRNSK